MKKVFWIVSILTACWLGGYAQDYNDQNDDDVYYQNQNSNSPPAPTPPNPDYYGPTYQTFYDQLTPYGQWINYPAYGYVWVPNQLPPDFSPYMTGGHWVFTSYGWTWASDYEWGWAAFHYGRWFMDDYYGWMWIPGYDWAPAWVVWGDYGDYYCWAPIGPGVIISPHYRPDHRWWHFVNHEHIMEDHCDRFVVRHEDVIHHGGIREEEINDRVRVISHANTYNQSVFFTGPKAEHVEKYTGHPVQRVEVHNVERAGPTHVQNNQLNIYRPNIQRTEKQPAPNNVKSVQDLHPQNAPNNQQPVRRENVQPNNNVQQYQPQQNNEAPRQNPQQWTPPRHNVQQPVQQQQQQPVQRAPVQRAPEQRAPERNFIPTERPAQQPVQHFSPPQQQRNFSPAPSRGGGGGRH